MRRKFMALVLAATFSAANMPAETNSAMLRASGPVVLNGAAADGSSALFSGDRLQTGNSSATVSSRGTTIVLPANTDITYRGNVVELAAGSVRVNTVNGASARVGRIAVSPAASGKASFQLSRLENKVTIVAESGDVRVSDGGKDIVVPEGTSTTTQDRDKDKQAGAVPPAAAKGGNLSALSPLATKEAAIIGGIGAVTLGTVLAIVTTGEPASSDRRVP